MSEYKKAIIINPNYGKAHERLATLYYYKKEYAFAIEYCDKAAELGIMNYPLLKYLKPYREQGALEK